MSSSAAFRSVIRSTATQTVSKKRLINGTTSNSIGIPFRVCKLSPLSQRIFRSHVEMSCCVESFLPYHAATASALRSMLPVNCRTFCWTPEGS